DRAGGNRCGCLSVRIPLRQTVQADNRRYPAPVSFERASRARPQAASGDGALDRRHCCSGGLSKPEPFHEDVQISNRSYAARLSGRQRALKLQNKASHSQNQRLEEAPATFDRRMACNLAET